jgi:polysaccharide pyruvyl transferase CsaB
MERILALGYFGAGNFGDDALLVDFLQRHGALLNERGAVCDVLVNSRDPLAGFIEAKELRPLIGSSIPKAEALKLDPHGYRALIAPGGSLLQDASSLKSLMYYLLVLRRFAQAGVPVLLCNQGLGPFTTFTARYFAPRVLKRLQLLSLRDAQSYAWAQTQPALRRHPALHYSCDPVLSAALAPYPDCPLLDAWREPYLLVIPRATGDLPCPGDPVSEPAALAQLIARAQAVTGLSPLLLSFHAGRDDAFCQAVADQVPGGAPVLHPAKDPYPASAVWQAVAGAGLTISYRLHGLVCAAALGRVALGVAYDPKVSAFCEEFGYPCCFPATVHQAEAHEDVERLWEARTEVAAAVAETRAVALARLASSEALARGMW